MGTAEKPQDEKRVLAWDGTQWVRAIWVARHTKEQAHDQDGDWHDYNETDDTYYWPEGWYEVQTHGGDEMFWYMTNGAESWQDMPPPPTHNTDESGCLRAEVFLLRSAIETQWATAHDEHCTNMRDCTSFGGTKECHHPRP